MKIPCLIIGWAEKYGELAEMFAQERFMFDIRDGIDIHDISRKVEKMGKEFVNERDIIIERLKKYQKENCFDIFPSKL